MFSNFFSPTAYHEVCGCGNPRCRGQHTSKRPRTVQEVFGGGRGTPGYYNNGGYGYHHPQYPRYYAEDSEPEQDQIEEMYGHPRSYQEALRQEQMRRLKQQQLLEEQKKKKQEQLRKAREEEQKKQQEKLKRMQELTKAAIVIQKWFRAHRQARAASKIQTFVARVAACKKPMRVLKKLQELKKIEQEMDQAKSEFSLTAKPTYKSLLLFQDRLEKTLLKIDSVSTLNSSTVRHARKQLVAKAQALLSENDKYLGQMNSAARVIQTKLREIFARKHEQQRNEASRVLANFFKTLPARKTLRVSQSVVRNTKDIRAEAASAQQIFLETYQKLLQSVSEQQEHQREHGEKLTSVAQDQLDKLKSDLQAALNVVQNLSI